MHDAPSFAIAIPARQPRRSPNLRLQLGVLGAFGRKLIDAGFAFAGYFVSGEVLFFLFL